MAASSFEIARIQRISKEAHSGWLTKQGGRMKNWRRRWCTIRDTQLLYFKEPTDQKPLGVITLVDPYDIEKHRFREVKAVPEEEEPKKKFCFEIRGMIDQRVYYMFATSAAEQEAWIDALQRVAYARLGGGMFGNDLTVQVVREGRGIDCVPEIVRSCVDFLQIHGLKEVGIFRLPGRSSRVKQLKALFNTAGHPDLAGEEVHVVASLLKLYLRELPEPLLTFGSYHACMDAAKRLVTAETEGVALLQAVIASLPSNYAITLRYLCQFLYEVQCHADVNKMTLPNLATVFAPSFLIPKDRDDTSLLMESTAMVHALACVLIGRPKDMFARMPPLPPTAALVDAVRNLSGPSELLPDQEADEDEDAQPTDGALGGGLPGFQRLASVSASSGIQGPVRQLQLDLMHERQLRLQLEERVAALTEQLREKTAAFQVEYEARTRAEHALRSLMTKK